MLNLSVLLEDSARTYPEHDAIVLGDTRLTYAEVNRAANQVANLFVQLGVHAGDRVAISCPNLPQFPIIYYGILKAGAVVVPLNILSKGREVAYYLDDADVGIYFCFEGDPELPMIQEAAVGVAAAKRKPELIVLTADPSAPSPLAGTRTFTEAIEGQSATFETVATTETDTAVILYTSGTTGNSKGAALTHANVVFNALTCNRIFESTPATDTHLIAVPLFHSFGSHVQMNAGFSVAATLVLMPRFEARRAISLLEDEEITFFAGVPTVWWQLLQALDDTVDVAKISRNLRVGVSGGASMPVEIIGRVRDRFGVSIVEGYGLSETSPVGTMGDLHGEPRPGSIGRPIWGVECKLIDPAWSEITEANVVGEIAIRGHNVMKGYLNRPDATAEVMRDDWFRTGDLAHRDSDGYYYIVDRSKDMIIRGGYNVYPREVEEVLIGHPDVSLVAVVGIPHESHGEEVKAFVIRNPGAEVSETELICWAKERMASHKYPRSVVFVDSLPMTASGKILKRELITTETER